MIIKHTYERCVETLEKEQSARLVEPNVWKLPSGAIASIDPDPIWDWVINYRAAERAK